MADRLFAWLLPRLKADAYRSTTRMTETRPGKAVKAAPEATLANYAVGQTSWPRPASRWRRANRIAPPGVRGRLDERRTPSRWSAPCAAAVTSLIFVAFLLCGMYMRYRQRGPLASLTRLIVLLLLAIATVALARWARPTPGAAKWSPCCCSA